MPMLSIGTGFRIAAALALLETATAASAAARTIALPPATKPEGWQLLLTGAVVVGLIAWRRFSSEDVTND